MLILVVGCGSIGKRHIRNLKTLSAGNIIAQDINVERCYEVAEQCGIKTFSELGEALAQKPDAAYICTPTSLHVPHALSAARSGCHLFIEKPLSDSLDGVDELLRVVAQKNLVTLVSCNMRFHPGIALMKEMLEKGSVGKVLCARVQHGQYLPDWHPWEDYRRGYSANRALGGGVILDSVHEIDYITYFLGEVSQVFCFSDKISSLEIDTEDIAEILLQFKSGAIAEVHLDYIQRYYSRSCHIIGEEGTILWDFNDKQVKFYSAKTGKWQVFSEKPDYDINEMYVEEAKHFMQCVERKAKPLQDIEHAKRVLEIAIAAKESSKNRRAISSWRSSMDVVAIVQARMGSTRLPGKVMKEIMGEPVLWHTINRLKGAKQVNKIIIATTARERDKPILRLADRMKIDSFAGSEENVLDRYYQAATKFGVEIIVRITADCPLVDPHVVDKVIQRYLKGNCDYAANTLKRTYPDGLDVEVFSFAALEKAWRDASSASEREHVTPYIRKNPDKFVLANVENSVDLSHLRWVVDWEDDLQFVRQVYKHLYKKGQNFYTEDVIDLLDKNPELIAINAHVRQKEPGK